ncbi:hypothetical protein [Halobacillus litoralis]|uniref:Uncharacterized protein n=1 Tax=Halobacillus litoralis TaxID=45668 RepID=A0A410MFE0_9BACI|nr:hypothetical protein [Halobacillus litoralis]QAS53454.1 hypothetical protein HLI_15225 [Halobacillus litoralis]
MTDPSKKEYLFLPTNTSSLFIELLGSNHFMALTTFKKITYKAEGYSKNETIQKILTIIEEDNLQL